jgi:hypothetical protein
MLSLDLSFNLGNIVTVSLQLVVAAVVVKCNWIPSLTLAMVVIRITMAVDNCWLRGASGEKKRAKVIATCKTYSPII